MKVYTAQLYVLASTWQDLISFGCIHVLRCKLQATVVRMKHSALWSFHKAKLKLTRANHQHLQAGDAYGEQNTAASNTSSIVWCFCKSCLGFWIEYCYKWAIVASKLLQDKAAPSGLRLIKIHNLTQRITCMKQDSGIAYWHWRTAEKAWTTKDETQGGKSSKYHAHHSLPPYHEHLQRKSSLLWTLWHSWLLSRIKQKHHRSDEQIHRILYTATQKITGMGSLSRCLTACCYVCACTQQQMA